jgi:hypothetical protein
MRRRTRCVSSFTVHELSANFRRSVKYSLGDLILLVVVGYNQASEPAILNRWAPVIQLPNAPPAE